MILQIVRLLLVGSAAPMPADTTTVDIVVEIPAGSTTKYEIDYCLRTLRVDRFIPMPVTYPANYGFVDHTLGGDGDALDALVFSREPLVPGSVIPSRVLGVLRMIDGGEEDHKLIAVPAEEVDPTYAEIASLADLPSLELQRLEAFFRVYKSLDPTARVELFGFGDVVEARAMLDSAIARIVREPPCPVR